MTLESTARRRVFSLHGRDSVFRGASIKRGVCLLAATLKAEYIRLYDEMRVAYNLPDVDP